jgi:hypothetical protein
MFLFFNVLITYFPLPGKSNFFYAIQFVLSDEYSHLRPEQRQVRHGYEDVEIRLSGTPLRGKSTNTDSPPARLPAKIDGRWGLIK